MKHKITTVDDIPTPVSEKINDSFVEIFIPSYKIINISGIRIIIMYKGYNELILLNTADHQVESRRKIE